MTTVPSATAAHPDHPNHPAPARGLVSLAALWFGIFGGPAAWAAQTLVNFPVAAHGCFPRMLPLDAPVTAVRGIAFAVSVVALAVGVAAVAVSVASWRRTRHEHQQAGGSGSEHAATTAATETGEGRTRFMALSGILLSGTFLLLSLVHVAAVFLVAAC